jgi:molecular chaperone DnaK
MVKTAEAHASEDKARRDQIEARNQLDALVYKVEKDSKEWVEKLPADAKTRLDAAVEGGRQALRTGEAEGIRTALDELNAAYSAAGAALYQSQAGATQEGAAGAQQPGAEAGAAPGTPPEDVVEADYEIVDDKK